MSIKVVSLFSGGGGLDLGFANAGFNIIWAIDNEPDAVATYKANIGDHIICCDINKINLQDIPDCDVIIGGPPCQSFSLAGNRNTEDKRGMLVWRYIDIINAKKPKAFVFENVTGLLSAKTKAGERILEQLLLAFKNIGYKLSWQVMNAVDYGVPQKRKRVIVVGFKEDNAFVFPEPMHTQSGSTGKRYVTVAEALGDLGPAEDGNKEVLYRVKPQNDYQFLMRSNSLTNKLNEKTNIANSENLNDMLIERKNNKNSDTCNDKLTVKICDELNGEPIDKVSVTEHVIPTMSELDRYIIAHVKPGGNYMDIPPEVNSQRIRRLQKEGGHTTCYGRMKPDEPSYTINTYFNRPNVGCNIHYKEDRLITVREAMRLQSFPDNYELVASSKQGKHLIIGNAVPPLLAKAIAEQLKKYL